MLERWLFPTLGEFLEDLVFQQDRAPPYWHCEVRNFLEVTSEVGIGRCTENKLTLLKWPPQFPDLTVYNFFLWGYVKDEVYIPTMPQMLQELCEPICIAINSINIPMLAGVWDHLQYRLKTCYMANGTLSSCGGS